MVFLDTDLDARAVLLLDPGLVLDGPTPRLIDEWQVEPSVWNHVRRRVDDRGQAGQFILTGSAMPADDVTSVARPDVQFESRWPAGQHTIRAHSLRPLDAAIRGGYMASKVLPTSMLPLRARIGQPFVGSTDASRLSALTILYPVAGLAPAPGVGVRRRRVTVVPLARVEPVLVAAARVRLNAMTASTSRALLGVAVDPHERFGLAFAYRSTCLARG